MVSWSSHIAVAGLQGFQGTINNIDSKVATSTKEKDYVVQFFFKWQFTGVYGCDGSIFSSMSIREYCCILASIVMLINHRFMQQDYRVLQKRYSYELLTTK